MTIAIPILHFWRALSLRGSEGGGKKRKSDEATEHFCGEVDFPAQFSVSRTVIGYTVLWLAPMCD